MRMILSIAKAELRTLFYSPVAWFLAIAFQILCAISYFIHVIPLMNAQEIAQEMSSGFTDWGITLTSSIFLLADGPVETVVKNISLFVPLLTMGLISREYNANTIQLLHSSPVRLRQVVMGKFLAVLAYNALLVCIAGSVFAAAKFHIKDWDYGLLLSSGLGFFLLTSAFTAIGIFMSSLTSYQILSAIGTFAVLYILQKIGTLWQDIDFVRDLTYSLFLPGHLKGMLKGLICTRDIIYFLMVIFIFLGFTLIRLRSLRETKPWYVQMIRVTAVLSTALLISYVTSLPPFNFYKDALAGDKNTIAERTQALMHEIGDEPLEVTLYTNLLGKEAEYGFPKSRNLYLTTLWENYLRFKPDIRFKYEYYYYYEPALDDSLWQRNLPGKTNGEMAASVAKGYRLELADFKTAEELKKTIDLDPESNRLIMQLKYKGRTTFLRTFGDPYGYPAGASFVFPQEQTVASALKRLVHPEKVPLVLFTTGNLERYMHKTGEREYFNATIKKFKQAAPINNGFDFDTINLNKQDIPAGIAALVVADPKTALSAVSLEKILDYIDKGGNIVFTGEPGKQQLLNPVLNHLGVEMMDGSLVEPSKKEMPHKLNTNFTRHVTTLSEDPFWIQIKKEQAIKTPIDTTTVLMPGATALSFTDSNGFVKKPLLLSRDKTWIKHGKLVTDSAEILYKPEEGDVKGSFPTGLQLNRQVGMKQQRIAIFSDADFLSNGYMSKGEAVFSALLSWMCDNEFPVYATRPKVNDNMLTSSTKGMKILSYVYTYVLPGILLLAAIILLTRRKRK